MEDFSYEYYNQQVDSFDTIKAVKPTSYDFEIANLIEKEIIKIYKDFNLKQYAPETFNCSSLKKSFYMAATPLLDLAAKEFQNVGCGMHLNNLCSIFINMNFYSFKSDAPVFFCLSKLKNINSSNHREFVGLIFPESCSLVTSRFFVCHEFAHILKERFLEEDRLFFTKKEVIPVALELITAFKCGNLMYLKKLISDRVLFLYQDIQQYLIIKDEMQKEHTPYEKRGLTFCFDDLVGYLSSFYYSLIIFRIYLEEPEYIIELINMVLGGQITTEELFEYLDTKKFDNYASDGLTEFKKYLK